MNQLSHTFGGVTVVNVVLSFYEMAKIRDVGKLIKVLDSSKKLVGILCEREGIERMWANVPAGLDMPYEIRDKEEGRAAQMHKIENNGRIVGDESIRGKQEFLRVWIGGAGDDREGAGCEACGALGEMMSSDAEYPFAAKLLCKSRENTCEIRRGTAFVLLIIAKGGSIEKEICLLRHSELNTHAAANFIPLSAEEYVIARMSELHDTSATPEEAFKET